MQAGGTMQVEPVRKTRECEVATFCKYRLTERLGLYRKLSAKKLMLLNYGVREDT